MQMRVRASKKVTKSKKPAAKSAPKALATITKKAGPSDQASIAAAEAQNRLMQSAKPILATVALMKVDDLESQQKASNTLVELARMKKEVNERRDFVVKPLKEHVKRLDGMFKPVLEQLEQADENLRGKVLAFRQRQSQAAERERLRLMAEAEAKQEQAEELEAKGKVKQAAAMQEQAQESAITALAVTGPGKQLLSDEGSVGTSKRWIFEIEDAGAVPRQYLVPDEKAIRRAVTAGERTIPGVRIFETEGLAVSGA